jgi:heme-degrading monooxygenase HmoA
MYATIRRYKNAQALADAMSSRKDEVKQIISGVPGFVSYYATREGDTMTSVSVYNDKAGCDESTRRAREWVAENVKSAIGAPEISGGDVFINFSK